MPASPHENNLLTAGIVQFDVRLGEVDANLERALAGIRQLAEEGAGLVVLPELWASGFDYPQLARHALRTPDLLAKMADAAVANGIVIAGSLLEQTTAGMFNTLYVHDRDGSLAGSYQKIHLFKGNKEDHYFEPGDHPRICQTAAGDFGLMISYDLRFPELSRNLALQGADGLIICAQWPAARIHHWETLVRARAVENQLMVIAANRCGKDKRLDYGGRSQIVTPSGEIVAATEGGPGVISAALDVSEKDRLRESMPCLRERRPEVYRLTDPLRRD